MLKLPSGKQEQYSKCNCRPICKNRRREWKGELQETSAELLLERKPLQECLRKWPTKIYPNGTCPLFGKTKQIIIDDRTSRPTNVIRTCQAPINNTTETTYLNYAEMAKRLGAWDAVKACCAFCTCGGCCSCDPHYYILKEESHQKMCKDMRRFDKLVKDDCKMMRIMYDKI